MRESGLLAIGAVLLIVALGFAGAVGVYAMRQDGQEEVAALTPQWGSTGQSRPNR